MKQLYALIIIFFVFSISCTRKPQTPTPQETQRGLKHVFTQGVGSDLYDIKQFQVIKLPSSVLKENILTDKAVRIKTASSGEKAKISVSSYGTSVASDSNISFINQYYYLNYSILKTKTNNQKIISRLLGNVKYFKGFPNTTYHIVPHLEGNYLVLYRLSDPKKLPFDEMSLSVKVGNKVATPLVGYPVEYCVAEKILNSNNQETTQNRPKCDHEVTIKNATYIRIKESQKKVFTYQSKIDVFPRDFFDGEWFFVKTYIKSSNNSVTGLHQNFANAELIEFVKTPNSLKIVDASGYKIKDKDKITNFYIPVKWKEYEISRSVDNKLDQFSERENTKSVDTTRPFFKINFVDFTHNEVSTLGTAETDNVFITDDYFSFVIKVSGKRNIWIKYAFKRNNTNRQYIEKQWLKEDSTVYFPIFHVARNYYKTEISHTRQDTEKFLRVSRFNGQPNTARNSVRVLKWYFSKQTVQDEKIRNLARRAIQYWNTVFQKAGENSNYKIKIVLDESEAKELGDPRYNIINILPSLEFGFGYAGLGPNIASPVTGEILFSTTNIILSAIIDPFILTLRDFIRFNVYPPVWKLLHNSPGVSHFLHTKIKTLCPQVIQFIADKREENLAIGLYDTPLGDAELIQTCASQIGEDFILHTIMHELGHNFGYRHVFSASADKNNFYKSYDEIKNIFGKDIKTYQIEGYPTPPKYSSVMDYGNFSYPSLPVPGKYDIAITRYLYFNKVELNNGKMIDIPDLVKNDKTNTLHQKSITELIKNNKVGIKKYKVCGGQLKEDRNKDDPLCMKWDYGTTPVEITQNLIKKIENNIMIHSRRYDSEKIFMYDIRYHLKSLVPFLLKWSNYRDELLANHSTNIKEYSFANPVTIKEYQDIIATEAQNTPVFKEYYDLRNIIFAFYKKLYFLPSKHCIYLKDNKYKAVSFDIIIGKVQKDYKPSDKAVIVNCQSPVVRKWAKQTNQGTFITDVGYSLITRSYLVKPTSLNSIDELSPFFNWTQKRGKNFIISTWGQILNTMSTSVFQEPDFFKTIRDGRLDQLTEGRDFNSYIQSSQNIDLPKLLSYKSDLFSKKIGNAKVSSTFVIQTRFIEHKVSSVRSVTLDEQELDLLLDYEGSLSYRNTIELSEILEQTVSRIKSKQPFIYYILQDYIKPGQKTLSDIGLLDVILKHPLVCVSNMGTILMPRKFFPDNSYQKICKTFNIYKECVKNHADQKCEDIEQKKEYIKFINSEMYI